jgi:hypothetical protein
VIEELLAPGPGDAEDNARLSKVVRSRQPPLEDDPAVTAEHAARVPPARSIHLAVAGDYEPYP